MAKAIEPFYLELGRRVQEAREKAGLSQQQVGRLLSPPVTRASIANIEGGKQRVLGHTLVALSLILDVPVATLMFAGHAPSLGEPTIEQELKLKVGRQVTARVMHTLRAAGTKLR